MAQRPNIVIFNPDSYRGDVLGHLGNHGAVTPNIDAIIANGGVSYANAFAQNPVCTPSRCSFMTGWYPHVHGHRSMHNMLKPHEPDLLSVLRREGYHIWWGGKNDLFSVTTQQDYLDHCAVKHRITEPFRAYHAPAQLAANDPRKKVFYRGVSTRDGSGEPYADWDRSYVNGAVDVINATPGDRPFCIFLPLTNPHPAYFVENEFHRMINPDALPPRLPIPKRNIPLLDALRQGYETDRITEDDWKAIRHIYYAMCTKVDYLFGLVVNALKTKGLYDNTLIIFLSDHGDFTGDYSLPEKCHGSLQDVLLRVPFLIKPPTAFDAQPGIRTHLVELIDMTATIYNLLDIDPDYDCQGKDLCKSLLGDNRDMRNAVFAEVGSRVGEEQFLNHDPMPPDSFYSIQCNCGRPAHRSGTYAASCRTSKYKYIRRGYNNHHELYDLMADIGELHNLSGFQQYAEIEREMADLLLDHFMTTGDVLPRKQDSRSI